MAVKKFVMENYVQTGKCYEPPLQILISKRETDSSKERRNGKLHTKFYTNRKVLRAATVNFNQQARNRWQKRKS
jgi:hypothetical protein